MPRCPNCSYQLVLLSSRQKYKCALCSRLYLQKEIENKEFREWNKKQRKVDIENYVLKQKRELKQLRALRRSIKSLFNKALDSKMYYQKNKERFKRRFKDYYYKNKERLLEQDDKWREANQERISLTKKRWLVNNRDKRREFLKAYVIKNKSLEKQKLRLGYWRRRQKLLADQYLENSNKEVSTIEFYPFSPTFVICELLGM